MEGRTYRFMSDALFHFGYGLSYTQFDIGTASLSKTSLGIDESLQITLPVTNAGKRDGTEVIQIYVKKINDIDGPIKTLRGFSRAEIPEGKTQQVSVELPPSSFEFYDRNQREMAVTPGEYEILYGNSSMEKDLKVIRITIK